MANVLNRTTKQYLRSVNTPDYPTQDWIINPDLSAVRGQPTKYWTISGDTVSLLDQSARDAIDAAELDARRDATAATIEQVQSYERAFAEILIDEINLLRAAVVPPLSSRSLMQLKIALRNKLDR